jgi:hypothetical protein
MPHIVTEPLDPNTLMEDKLPGISLESYASAPTSQGFPSLSTKNGDINYSYPRAGSVAWLGACSDGVNLDCYWGPQGSSAALGVRECRVAT